MCDWLLLAALSQYCEEKAELRQELADFKKRLKRTEKASLKALDSWKTQNALNPE